MEDLIQDISGGFVQGGPPLEREAIYSARNRVLLYRGWDHFPVEPALEVPCGAREGFFKGKRTSMSGLGRRGNGGN